MRVQSGIYFNIDGNKSMLQQIEISLNSLILQLSQCACTKQIWWILSYVFLGDIRLRQKCDHLRQCYVCAKNAIICANTFLKPLVLFAPKIKYTFAAILWLPSSFFPGWGMAIYTGRLKVIFCPPQSGAGDMEMPGVRPRYVVSTLRFLFVDRLISNLHTSIILGI